MDIIVQMRRAKRRVAGSTQKQMPKLHVPKLPKLPSHRDPYNSIAAHLFRTQISETAPAKPAEKLALASLVAAFNLAFTLPCFAMDGDSQAERYQLLEELGSGSFGVVYKAIDNETGEVVAVKHIDLESSEDDIQEIQMEINCLSSCASPWVTQYKTSFLRGPKLWIVMEFLGGGSAQDLLKPGPFQESHVAIVCRELLLGLEYLHREGKIHRDIKAANVLLTQQGKVRLADFGVAAQLNSLMSIRNTLVGTPFWMAPEVIQENGYDFKADVWSVGITALELIHGAPPHADMHPMKVLFHIPKVEAPRLEGPQYSPEFKDFIATCLVKDPEYRPSSRSLLQHKFIRRAGRTEGLQEMILRKQEWDAQFERPSEPRYYQETMNAMTPVEEEDDWVFDTVKAATVNTSYVDTFRHAPARKPASTIRKASAAPRPESADTLAATSLISRLSLNENAVQKTPESTPPSTVRRTPAKRRASPSRQTSVKRKNSVRKPLAPDTSFGNGASTTRQFSRLSDNTPAMSLDGTLEYGDENRPPLMDCLTKEAVVGRRAGAKVVKGALQEVAGNTANYNQREAIRNVMHAWEALDKKDPEGEFMVLKLIIERVTADPRLSALLPEVLQQQQAEVMQPKLVLAQNNPHLKSHKRRQSTALPQTAELPKHSGMNLPGVLISGMEHLYHIENGLYNRWAETMGERWPDVE